MDKIFDIVDFDHNSELTATFKDFNYQLEDRSNQQQLTLSIENHNNNNNNNNQDHQNDVNDERKQKEMFRIDSAAAKIKLKNNFSELGGDGGGGDNDRMMNNNFIHKEEDDEGDDDELEEIFDNILDDILFSVLLQVHRSAKLGYFLINNNSNNNLDSLPQHQHQQISDYNHDDVLGFFSNKFDIMKPGAASNEFWNFIIIV